MDDPSRMTLAGYNPVVMHFDGEPYHAYVTLSDGTTIHGTGETIEELEQDVAESVRIHEAG